MTSSWSSLDKAVAAAIESECHLSHVPAGSILFRPGELCQNFPIVEAGIIKVVRTAISGREILLYRVGPGQSCILSTASLLATEIFAAQGEAETDVTARMLPARLFERLISAHQAFRRLVFAGYAERIAALMVRIEDLIDKPVDARLADCLIGHAAGGSEILLTHQELAAEIGSAREVVSRALAGFVRDGIVGLARGRVMIFDLPRLASLAAS